MPKTKKNQESGIRRRPLFPITFEEREKERLEKERIEKEQKELERRNKIKFYNYEVNKKIREFLDDGILSIEEFAHSISVTVEGVRLWKNGHARPAIDKLLDIADIMDVSVDYLLGKSDCKRSDYENVNKKLGLTEDSIIRLSEGKLNKKDYSLINYIICNDNFWLSINENLAKLYDDRLRKQLIDVLKNDNEFIIKLIKTNIMEEFNIMLEDYIKSILDKPNGKPLFEV